MQQAITLAVDGGILEIFPQGSGSLKLIARPASAAYFVNRHTVVTKYPLELIKHVLEVKGLGHVCDEIARDEDPHYIKWRIETGMFSFVDKKEFSDKRILDFGCGSGSSTMNLTRLLPRTEIIGVELEPSLLSIARARARFYGLPEASFRLSPSEKELPADIGDFDFIVMHAVYEHLLPDERDAILALLWNRLKPGGCLFVDETPYRYFPIEQHTTGLPLINYLPDRATHWVVRNFCKRLDGNETWSTLLRKGIRGATTSEILKKIRRTRNGRPTLLEVSMPRQKDRIDLWYHRWHAVRKSARKTIAYFGFKAVRAMTGIEMIPEVTIAIRKA